MPPQNLLRGIGLISAAVLVFACGDAATKYLAQRYPVPLVAALRYVLNVALLLAILAPRQGALLWRVERHWLVAARAACLTLSSLCAGLALQRIPLAEAVSLLFLYPFGVLLLSRPLLGERVTALGWIAAATGFAGVLLVVRPGAGLDPLGVFFGLGTAAGSVGYNLLSRLLAQTERTEPLVVFSALFGAIAFGSTLPWHLDGFAPGAFDLMIFLALGLLATLGHLLFTAAFRHAPAHVLAPVTYLHLFWAGLLGILLFGQSPDAISLSGMALIAGAGLAVAVGAHRGRDRRPGAQA